MSLLSRRSSTRTLWPRTAPTSWACSLPLELPSCSAVLVVKLENKFPTIVSIIIMEENTRCRKHYWYSNRKYILFHFIKFCSFKVVLLEILKLTATILRMKCGTPSFDKASIKASLKFLLPSVIYAVNNNIYLGTLHFIFW